jgi:hypothetical protein
MMNFSCVNLFNPVPVLSIFIPGELIWPGSGTVQLHVVGEMLFLIPVFLWRQVVLLGKLPVKVGFVVKPTNIHDFLHRFIG